MSVTITEGEHVAQLARLRLSAEELEQHHSAHVAIVDYMNMLAEVDVRGVRPTAQVTDLANMMWDDEERGPDGAVSVGAGRRA